jgi:hypothetical protein
MKKATMSTRKSIHSSIHASVTGGFDSDFRKWVNFKCRGNAYM